MLHRESKTVPQLLRFCSRGSVSDVHYALQTRQLLSLRSNPTEAASYPKWQIYDGQLDVYAKVCRLEDDLFIYR